MRLWHYELLPYLPDLQLKGQLRELVAIMRDWRDKGKTNHLLINRVMEYPKEDIWEYLVWWQMANSRRGGKKPSDAICVEFANFSPSLWNGADKRPFDGWHNKEYLRVCMANLYEKHRFGVGKSRITDREWQTLLDGYKTITGEDYKI